MLLNALIYGFICLFVCMMPVCLTLTLVNAPWHQHFGSSFPLNVNLFLLLKVVCIVVHRSVQSSLPLPFVMVLCFYTEETRGGEPSKGH